MNNLPRTLDENEEYMVAATGYFVDVETEYKYFAIGGGEFVRTEATQAEMVMWTGWLTSLQSYKIFRETIAGRLEGLIGKLEEQYHDTF